MLRTKLSLSRILPGLAACCALAVSSTSVAAPPLAPGAAEPDYEASGFVVPAGYQAPTAQAAGMQPGAPYGQVPTYSVAQVGFFGAGAGPACDSGQCGPECGCGAHGGGGLLGGGGHFGGGLLGGGLMHGGAHGCGCGGGMLGHGGACGCGGVLGGGGLLGKLSGCGGCGTCGECGLGRLRHMCMFCQGSGCGVCQSMFRGHLIGALGCLAPYTEAGIGAQRWYDLSVEALFMSIDSDSDSFGVTSNGVAGPIVLRTGDAMDDDLEAGVRLSAAFICGAGGNIEVTYMGVEDFGGSASVSSGTPDLYSFISEFGTDPGGINPGFDDTDRSLFQGITSESSFHSGEVNYRRRWVGPYSRFQGSWLAGIRYIDFDDSLGYRTSGLFNNGAGANGPRFFNGEFDASNSMTGFQIGGDLWWNIYPGINLGVGLKGAALDNDARMRANIVANSLNTSGTLVADDSETAWLTEFNATLIYRFAYSWSFRTSYYLVDIDNVGLGSTGIESFGLTGVPVTPALGDFSANREVQFDGVSFGVEYMW